MIDAGLWNGPNRVRAALGFMRVTLWRVLLCFVIVPAAMAASIWMLAAAFGATSTQTLVKDLYAYADTSIRAAPAGMVRVQTCDDVLPPSAPPLRNQYGDILGCQHPRMINVPASQVMADQAGDLERLYWTLVGLSTLYVFCFYIARRFKSIGERGDALIDLVIVHLRR
jgi:hypothetical protein